MADMQNRTATKMRQMSEFLSAPRLDLLYCMDSERAPR